jgi:hypothetical protein
MKTRGFLAIIASFTLILGLTTCNNPFSSGNGTSQKLTIGYLSNLMVDIGDATALGISKRTVSASRNVRAASNQEKNYLVKTTVDYSHGNVEWDESGLTNVTFKKRTTETVVIPIYDEEGNLIEEQEVEDGQTVTQDEIPAQVNRLYVYNTYSFIQFVPDDTVTISDTRPDDLGILDSNGYFKYDKQDYYNDDYHQSFVIENSTGNIYSLEDKVYIESIHNGLLKIKDSPYIWDCRIKDNDELEIFTLFQNTAINIGDYFKDKYGNNYICNDLLDTRDSTTNTIFYKNAYYKEDSVYKIATNSGDVVFFNGNIGTYWSDPAHLNSVELGATQIRIMTENLTSRPISMDEYLEIDDGFFIKNKELFIWGSNWGGNNVVIADTDTVKIKHYVQFGGSGYGVYYGFYNVMSYDIALVRDYVGNQFPADNIYYYKINFGSLTQSDEPFYFSINTGSSISPNSYLFTNSDLKLILEGIDRNVGDITGPWTKTTINGQDEYIIIMKEVNGEKIPVAVKTSEYVAERQ